MAKRKRTAHRFGASVAAIVLATGLTVTPAPDARAGTVLAMSGNGGEIVPGATRAQLGGNPFYPSGSPVPSFLPVGEYQKGYFDPANPGSPYHGYDYRLIEWPAATPFTFGWDGHTSFEQSQQTGVANLDAGIHRALADRPGEPVVAVGYSSSANVIVRTLRNLAAAGSPHTGDVSFVAIGNMNRPNGGIGARLPGVNVPVFGIDLDGSTPVDTDYRLLDVGWQYDPISDFPANPLNPLALANSVVSFLLLHSNYFPASLATTPRAFPDTTVGNITYVTLKPPRLPLLMPLAAIGVPPAPLDLVEPALKVLVDSAYDYEAGPATPVPVRLLPTRSRLEALPRQLADAVTEGVNAFADDLCPRTLAVPDTSRTPTVLDTSRTSVLERASQTPAMRDAPRTSAVEHTSQTPARERTSGISAVEHTSPTKQRAATARQSPETEAAKGSTAHSARHRRDAA